MAAGANQDWTVQRQSFGSNSIYGGVSSNWLSTTSTVATLGVAPGGFVSSAEPAMMTAKAGESCESFHCDRVCRWLASRGSHTGHDRSMKPFTRRRLPRPVGLHCHDGQAVGAPVLACRHHFAMPTKSS